MKQSLQIKLGQQLTMTPQLQQAIKLLQLSSAELEQEIQSALEENPMLEVAEDEAFSVEDTTKQASQSAEPEAQQSPETTESNTSDEPEWNQDIPGELALDTQWDDIYQPASPAPSGINDDFQEQGSTSDSLQDHLAWQLNLTPMSDKDRHIATMILDAVAPSGLLTTDLEELHAGLDPELEIDLDEVVAVIHRLQHFDPPGVVARDLRECLLIQLRQLDAETPSLAAAISLVDRHLTTLAARDFRALMRRLRLTEAQLKVAVDLIRTLNPSPGEAISSAPPDYITPDVIVFKKDEQWHTELNPELAPRLRVNADYAALVRRSDNSRDNCYLRDHLQEARWFIKSLQSRHDTLLRVSTEIVRRQQDFLEHGEEAMIPLVLHDIAEAVEMHESTISRVTTQKYMHTARGIFELKYFFSSHVSTESGGECSSTAIRAIIKRLVSEENPRKPLSDSKITQLLSDQGIKVARRTIAKYRESMSIPPSNERKNLV
ncbi:MAG: RNA polymerase factor sigma-54 [Pseudomonadales bacterium]